jgi:hypothetical protein
MTASSNKGHPEVVISWPTDDALGYYRVGTVVAWVVSRRRMNDERVVWAERS